MVALEEWLAAIEEDYQTFLTLPTPFTGNKYWQPAKPIRKWDNFSYQLLIECQPCQTFQELREQIDLDLAKFDVAPDYSEILREIEQHHGWAHTENSGVSVNHPSRLALIENVQGHWQQVRRLADVLQSFVYPFGSAKQARAGKRQADFFASFYGGIVTLCNWLVDYDHQVQTYRRSCRERAITLQAERRDYQIQAGIEPTGNELIYTTTPEGDLKNHEFRQGYMLRLEICARLLGQLVQQRFPVLARRFSLLNCAPEIPITSWKEREDFPFGKLKDELQQVRLEALIRRQEAAKLEDTPKKRSLPSLPPIVANSLKQFGESLNGQLLDSAQKYPDLQLVAVYGGNAFANWPKVPGRVSGEVTIGLWQQDWRDILGIDGSFVPPIKSLWLAIEGKLWEAFFYFARKPKCDEPSQLLDQHAKAGFEVFEHLAPFAANHLGISPNLANDDSKPLPLVENSNLFHRWLERLFSTPESYQQTARPNDFTVRRLTGDVFMASARVVETLSIPVNEKDKENDPKDQGKSESPASPKVTVKLGRKPADEQTRMKEEKLYRNWQIASGGGMPMVEFARSNGYKLTKFEGLIDRVRKRLKHPE